MNIFNLSKENHQLTNPLTTVVKVEQLTCFDMIYVYHLLSEGSKLQLVQKDPKLNGDLSFEVRFNSFLLGYVTLANFSKTLFQDDLELDATILSMAKEKYLPLKSLDITIRKKDLKMVS